MLRCEQRDELHFLARCKQINVEVPRTINPALIRDETNALSPHFGGNVAHEDVDARKDRTVRRRRRQRGLGRAGGNECKKASGKSSHQHVLEKFMWLQKGWLSA